MYIIGQTKTLHKDHANIHSLLFISVLNNKYYLHAREDFYKIYHTLLYIFMYNILLFGYRMKNFLILQMKIYTLSFYSII